MLIFIHGAVTALFIILGIVFLNGKGSFLIAGYNTASQAEKDEIDEKKLCKYVGILMLLLAGCFLVIMVSSILEKMWLFWVGFALFLLITVIGVIFINTGNRIKK